jgi:hypothetical protein
VTPADLKTLCNPLGRGWQKSLASHLEISDRTMRRKVKGDSPISKSEEAEIRRFVKRKLKGRP